MDILIIGKRGEPLDTAPTAIISAFKSDTSRIDTTVLQTAKIIRYLR
jgi:hypothetical protein